MTEEQAKILYETHAKVTNGLTQDVQYIKENMVTKDVCTAYRGNSKSLISQAQNRLTTWLSLIGFLGMLTLGALKLFGF